MAVLHHAFRCPMTPELEHEISTLVAAWENGDRDRLSAIALTGYAALEGRGDVHAAFSLSPDGPVRSWLQPEHISAGLTALVVLASHFIAVPDLSGTHDSNHHLLETQLPLMDWAVDDVHLLVRGNLIETMLENYASHASRLAPGGFRHTGGWTSASMAGKLKSRLDRLIEPLSVDSDEAAQAAWRRLDGSGAFEDARAMLAGIEENDWLVTAITH